MRGSRGSRVRDPPEKSQNIEFPSNTGPDPLKFSKLPSQHSTLGHLNGISLAGQRWPALSDIYILSPLKKKKEKNRQSCRVGAPLTKLSGSAHGSSSAAVVTRLIG